MTITTPKPPALTSLKVWTPEAIRALLATNDKAVGRALVALLDRQTNDERLSATTKHTNGRGFGSFDAGPMTGMAREFITRGRLTGGQLFWLRSCAGKAHVSRIGKYAGQLAEIANAKIEHAIMLEEQK